ncbi:1-acyl-sn-glycerol-3-phosphate acyltransferase [candidate division KSB1 bacterium]|nr:1-acyl-sn-glycerol-3-phosphate acyltransferase [candidate division KSB1 bacterium]
MKYLVSIFLYMIGSVMFLILAMSVIICSLVFKPKQYDKFIKWLCRMFLRSFFINVKVIGREKIDPAKTYIFMSNHVNIFDVFLLNGYIPNFARGVELDSHFNWPIWGPVITRFGNIPISQRHFQSSLNSLGKAEEALQNGTSIIILPEGHRTKDGNLLPFMRGPFLMAKKAKTDIVTTAMIGAFKIKQVNHWLVKPGMVKFVFGDIIAYESFKDLSTHELKDLVKHKIQKLISENE